MKKLSKIFAVVLVLALALSILPLGAGAIAATAGTTATLVTNVSALAVGDQVVIVAKNANYAISTNQKSSNRGAAAITKSGNSVTLTASVEVFTLKAGQNTGTFAFAVTDSTYLYAASTSANQLKTGSLGAYGSFNITIASSGIATIKSAGNTSRGWLRYNPNTGNGDPLFSCYSSGQQDVCIYKLDAAVQDTREDLPTASGAIVDAIFELQAGEVLSTYYKYDGDITLEGVVAGDASWNSTYSNGTVNFKVKDSTGAEKTMQAYKLVAGTGLTEDDVKGLTTGDTITVKGSVVKNYNGTYEFDGSTLVSVTKGQVALPALPADTADIIDAIYDLQAGESLDMFYDFEDFALSGVIAGDVSWSDSYNNGELVIKVNGTDKELKAFRFTAGQIEVDAIKALSEGDKVTFKVTAAKNYNGTYEMEYPVLTAIEKATNNDDTNNDTNNDDTTVQDPDKVGDNTAIVAMTSVMAIAVVALAVLVIGKKRMF